MTQKKTLAEVWAELEAENAAALERLQPMLERNRRFLEEQNLKYGGPPPPLTEDELDASETEIHNHIRRRGQPVKSIEKSE